MDRPPKIMLQIEAETSSYGRRFLRGIIKYSKLHGPWSFYRNPPFYAHSHITPKKHISQLKKVRADGIIVRQSDPAQVRPFLALGIPIVASPYFPDPVIPTIATSNEKIGALAAEHFTERGFHNFAYCGFEDMHWSVNRHKCFVKEIEKSNYKVHSFLSPLKSVFSPEAIIRPKLKKWLHSLPKPIGLMACNDDMGCFILDICQEAEILVPEQIAVLGVDNDELACEIAEPPLSSIDLLASNAGYRAAELMDHMLNGEPMSGQVLAHQPSYVTTRQSTDIIAVKDPDVAAALTYIKKNYNKDITVDDVALAVHLSSRHLFKKFKQTLGYSVYREIKSLRIRHICSLLAESDMSIYEITLSLGFTGIEHISRYFKEAMGISPTEYRKQYRI